MNDAKMETPDFYDEEAIANINKRILDYLRHKNIDVTENIEGEMLSGILLK